LRQGIYLLKYFAGIRLISTGIFCWYMAASIPWETPRGFPRVYLCSLYDCLTFSDPHICRCIGMLVVCCKFFKYLQASVFQHLSSSSSIKEKQGSPFYSLRIRFGSCSFCSLFSDLTEITDAVFSVHKLKFAVDKKMFKTN
jgi:hypothetical protein